MCCTVLDWQTFVATCCLKPKRLLFSCEDELSSLSSCKSIFPFTFWLSAFSVENLFSERGTTHVEWKLLKLLFSAWSRIITPLIFFSLDPSIDVFEIIGELRFPRFDCVFLVGICGCGRAICVNFWGAVGTAFPCTDTDDCIDGKVFFVCDLGFHCCSCFLSFRCSVSGSCCLTFFSESRIVANKLIYQKQWFEWGNKNIGKPR